MGTSKPSLKIKIDGDLLKQIRSFSADDRRILGRTIDDVLAARGNPHVHSGIGLRKLRGNFFECRSGLRTRLLFEPLNDGSLYFHLLGSHDEIRHFLKTRR
jgi:hypothetical protein